MPGQPFLGHGRAKGVEDQRAAQQQGFGGRAGPWPGHQGPGPAIEGHHLLGPLEAEGLDRQPRVSRCPTLHLLQRCLAPSRQGHHRQTAGEGPQDLQQAAMVIGPIGTGPQDQQG